MSAHAKELPLLRFEPKEKDETRSVATFASFSHFKVQVQPLITPGQEEAPDKDLLMAAEAAGTYRFLDDESENIYQA